MTFDFDWSISSKLFLYDNMPSLSEIVFNQTGKPGVAPTAQSSIPKTIGEEAAQESTPTQKIPADGKTNGVTEADKTVPRDILLESKNTNQIDSLNRKIILEIHGAKYQWDVSYNQIKKEITLTYNITKLSDSFIHKTEESDIILKYNKLEIPVLLSASITEAQLVQKACVVRIFLIGVMPRFLQSTKCLSTHVMQV